MQKAQLVKRLVGWLGFGEPVGGVGRCWRGRGPRWLMHSRLLVANGRAYARKLFVGEILNGHCLACGNDGSRTMAGGKCLLL
jgi:hypothetical protein